MALAINDAAERTVEFGSNFGEVITKNDIPQDTLQQVELNPRMYPEATKLCFSETKNVI